ncbi:MAG: HAMP domain-containing histidine kinase [Anaerolineae bacterium]|nr:HAMP domain-containing histidine kinase [Gloeobacterales cyanobacterium ES-bin-313]
MPPETLSYQNVWDAVLFLSKSGEILDGNRASQSLTQQPITKLKAHSFAEIFLPLSERSAFQTMLANLEIDGPAQPWPSNKPLCSNGRTLHAALFLQKITCQENPVVLAVIHRRSAPRLWVQMPQRKAAPSTIAPMLCHEIRDFLQGLHALIALQLRSQGEASQRQERLEQMRTDAERLAGTMENLLKIDRAELGYAYQPKLRSPALICQKIVQTLTSKDQQHISLSLDLPANLLLDEYILYPILTNLLNNAKKYSDPKKTIALLAYYREQVVHFEVKDRGIGIPEADLGGLFQPFRRCSNVGHIQGTGLGLNVVKRFVELAGGTIAVQSKLGKGTTFTVRLPLVRESATFWQALPSDTAQAAGG